jgi:hypothetical protein
MGLSHGLCERGFGVCVNGVEHGGASSGWSLRDSRIPGFSNSSFPEY